MPNVKVRTIRIGRDADTGRFITVKAAERRPTRTVVETIKIASKRGK